MDKQESFYESIQSMIPKNFPENVIAIHRRVDACAAGLSGRHAGRLKCRKTCHDCCRDEITVFEVEAEVIRIFHAELLRAGMPHPKGKCAFLDADGICRIYEHRPYVCRTQGLPLRWIEEQETETGELEIVEYRDICPLNEEGVPVERLDEDDCWTLGPVEGELAALEQALDNGKMRRILLRDLFTRR